MAERSAPLHTLLSELPDSPEILKSSGCVRVLGVSADTRELRAGELFVALPGDHVHGSAFIQEAVDRGASAVVTQQALQDEISVPVVIVADARRALSRLASTYWGHPSRELTVVGITGTDGKTTSTFLTAAVLESGGHSTGFLSTVDFKVGQRQWSHSARTTTPQPPVLHRQLREMVDAGNTHAVLESSSHGLRLSRLDDVAYDVAVLTNVTSEHLELHGTVEQYRLDKAKLFSLLGHNHKRGERFGIINADDPSADLYLRATAGTTLTYGTNRYADVVAHDVRQSADGLTFGVRSEQYGTTSVQLPMLGAYNVYNALAALCVGLSQGGTLEECAGALSRFPGVPGRMEQVRAGQPFAVVVDYAHTADSLRKVLSTLRSATAGRLIAVFGSAGERDRPKRPAMGEVAASAADYFVLTNEDPRGEGEITILEEIAAGAEAAGATRTRDFAIIPDRREAIAHAFSRARAGDLVLLAGKGHERSIEMADRKLPWNESEVARGLLRDLRLA